jgi:hypothetical protein
MNLKVSLVAYSTECNERIPPQKFVRFSFVVVGGACFQFIIILRKREVFRLRIGLKNTSCSGGACFQSSIF